VVRRAEQAKYSLESIDRMIAVLNALESAHDQSLEQVARGSGLSESTALRYLMSLAKHDFVERNARTGSFRLGLRLFRLGTLAVDRRDVVNLARPAMEFMLKTFGESVNLATRQQGNIVLISVLDSPNPVRKGSRVGETDVWHATSLGKALMAAMPAAEAKAILAGVTLTGFTPNTMTTTEAIFRDLQAARTRGYSIDDEEAVEGLRCVGAAIRDHDGNATYAMSVSGPKSRMSYSRIQEVGHALAERAAELSNHLGHSDTA
jgi:IclR family transcriptional regulator, acetate operon repressor